MMLPPTFKVSLWSTSLTDRSSGTSLNDAVDFPKVPAADPVSVGGLISAGPRRGLHHTTERDTIE
jgi:hypothetical protein